MTITEGCVLLLFTVILFMLVKSVPNMVAGIISGSSTGGISLGGGTGSLIAGGAALASGGAMIAAQMAGAGMALNSAYQQTVENKAQGGGMFTGAPSAGGLTGVMSMGMRSAGDFMANLASGTGTAMKENLQRTTSGGAVSANIDANRQANTASYDAAQAEQANSSDTPGGDAGAIPLSADGGDGGMGGISAGSTGGGSEGLPGGVTDLGGAGSVESDMR